MVLLPRARFSTAFVQLTAALTRPRRRGPCVARAREHDVESCASSAGPWTPVDAECRLVPPGAEENPPNYRNVEWAALRIPYPPPLKDQIVAVLCGRRWTRTGAAAGVQVRGPPGAPRPRRSNTRRDPAVLLTSSRHGNSPRRSWRSTGPKTRPFAHGPGAKALARNVGGQAEILADIAGFRAQCVLDPAAPLWEARRANAAGFERLVQRGLEWKLIEMPLPRLQVIGSAVSEFIYNVPRSGRDRRRAARSRP